MKKKIVADNGEVYCHSLNVLSERELNSSISFQIRRCDFCHSYFQHRTKFVIWSQVFFRCREATSLLFYSPFTTSGAVQHGVPTIIVPELPGNVSAITASPFSLIKIYVVDFDVVAFNDILSLCGHLPFFSREPKRIASRLKCTPSPTRHQ